MGHYCIVNAKTYATTVAQGAVRVRAKLGSDPKDGVPAKVNGKRSGFASQLADIYADALIMRPGDLVVPWVTEVDQGTAFHTVCRVNERAHIASAAEFPLVVPLAPSHTKYPGLTEAEALDLWQRRLLWNAIGKKSLGRGRSITHQTSLEDDELVARLSASGAATRTAVPTMSVQGMARLTIRTAPGGAQTLHQLAALPAVERLAAAQPTELCWAEAGEFKVEKALEAWLAENHDGPDGASFRSALLEEGEKVTWAGNYLPFGVAGASIDFVLQTETADGARRFHVIELKKDTASPAKFKQYASQVQAYSRFINRFLETWDPGATAPDVKSTVVTAAKRRKNEFSPDVSHIVYNIDASGTVHFELVKQ